MRGGPRLPRMEFKSVSGNTQQDKTTTLNHADRRAGGRWPKMFHQGKRMPEARLSSSAITNKPCDEGTHTLAKDFRGSKVGTQGSDLQNHNRALMDEGPTGFIATEVEIKGASAVKLPSISNSLRKHDGHKNSSLIYVWRSRVKCEYK